MYFPRVAVLISALAALPAQAIEPFVIKDIRVEGIQRTDGLQLSADQGWRHDDR
jgi:outer membrane protein assembly factor BamA